jgi:malate dehydrogenase (quinone)
MKKLILASMCVALIACSKPNEPEKTVDVLLIGGGIMSATLATYLHELEPDWTMEVHERLPSVADESSNAWNNAGTGHSAFCELNYTPEKADGSIDISKAVTIAESFEISKQFWAHQVDRGVLQEPRRFINAVPHMSFVWGDDNIEFLRKRHAALQQSPLFQGMEYSEQPQQISEWVPLIMNGRSDEQPVAATRMPIGTDVNFGEITRQLFAALGKTEQVTMQLQHEVRDITRNEDGTWTVVSANLADDETENSIKARFVFIGAGGGALKLLQMADIPEAKGYAGFPVGGQFLMTRNQDVVAQHQAKVYGLASVGSPPMSVPHLDTRVIDGEKVLLFGPFATFSSKFLKNGSLMDLPGSMSTDNALPMVQAGLDNLDLSQYLVGQLMLSQEDRIAELKNYFPEANGEDWELINAGQRVQIIKDDPEKGGVLQFGTEIVSSSDGSIAALLGASPGASTAAPIMLKLLKSNFKAQVDSPEWQAKLRTIFPAYDQSLNDDAALTAQVRAMTSQRLQLAPTTN